MDSCSYHKMLFLMNCLNDGWSVKKSNNTFIFFKKHKKHPKYLKSTFIQDFIESHMDIKVEKK